MVAAKPMKRGPELATLRHGSALDFWLALGLIAPVRLLFAWKLVAFDDCDEVYNYWEPLHYLLYGTGFQTWEYAPQFAIRSWAFILPLYTFAKPLVGALSKRHVLLAVRGLVAFLCSLGESMISITLFRTGKTRRVYTMLSLLSAGMVMASSAFLPNTFGMILVMLMLPAGTRPFGYYCMAVATIVIAWPYVGIWSLYLIPKWTSPVASLTHVVRSSIRPLILSTALATLVDWIMYGRLSFPVLNAILYNVVRDGAELYGTESVSFYLRSLLLHFNLLLPMAFIGVLMSARRGTSKLCRSLHIATFYLLLFNLMGHKEVRFLFPIYPFVVVAASVFLSRVFQSGWMKLPILCTVGLVSASRLTAVWEFYSAPVRLFDTCVGQGDRVCMGQTWHLYPTSFLLPRDASLSFFRESKGPQLPRKFSAYSDVAPKTLPYQLRGLNPRNGTWFLPSDMNDLNQEEPGQYVDVEAECDLLVKQLEESELQESACCAPMIDREKSRGLAKSFWIPGILQDVAVDFFPPLRDVLGKVEMSSLCLLTPQMASQSA